MLIESEHSMAREDRDGSGTEMKFMAMPPVLWGSIFWDPRIVRTKPSRFSLSTGLH
jgi:hypothetical protein